MLYKKGWTAAGDDLAYEYRERASEEEFSYKAFILVEHAGVVTVMTTNPPDPFHMETLFFRDYFEDPLHPTLDELSLFEIESGFPYLINERGENLAIN